MPNPYTQGSESITQAEHISPAKTGDNIQAKRTANYIWDSDTSSWVRQTASAGGAGVAAYSDSGGTDRKGLVDADRHVQVDVLSSALPTGAATAANQQTDALTDTQLRATAVPVSGTVTATPTGTQNVDVTANTIGLSTSANQTNGTQQTKLTDGTNTVAVGSLGDGDGSRQSLVVDGRMRMYNGTSFDRIRGNTTDGLLVNLGANNDVTVTGTVTATPTGTQDVQGNVASGASDSGNPVKIGGVYNTTAPTLTNGQRGDLQLNTRGGLKTSLYVNDAQTAISAESDDSDNVAVSATTNNLSVVNRNTVFDGTAWDRMRGDATDGLLVNLGSNNDVSLNAGTNAIGKLAANSGVDIGDVDVTSSVSATLDHGSNLDIDTTAEQITTTSFAAKFGVTVKSAVDNTGTVYIGNSDVTAGTTAATDGFPLEPGESITLPVNNSNLLYAIGAAANQKVFWSAV